MVSADRELWDEAESYYRESYAIAQRAGDVYLQGLCLLNRAGVHVARQRFADALPDAEAALVTFEALGDQAAKAGAYRVFGAVYPAAGPPHLAPARLPTP